MEAYVQSLLNRIQNDPDKHMRMIMIMDNAINEMHNNLVIASLPPELAAKYTISIHKCA